MLKIKGIIFVIIAVMIIGTMFTVVNATNDGFVTIVDEANNISNTQNTINASNVSSNKVNNRTANTTITNTSSLPKAGASQTISLIVTGIIFGISSLYAYRKINEYKIK